MEIIRGKKTDPACAERARKLAESWGKDPIVVSKDIPGFVANRIFYAMLREAFCLASKAGVGVGYVLAEGDGIVCIDLDHCLDDGKLAPWARTIRSAMAMAST